MPIPQNVGLANKEKDYGLADELAEKYGESKHTHKTRNENGQFAPSGQFGPTVNKDKSNHITRNETAEAFGVTPSFVRHAEDITIKKVVTGQIGSPPKK